MTAAPIFAYEIDFSAQHAEAALRALPAAPGVVALFGANATDRPHMLKAANLRRRLQGLLSPAEGQTKRLNLRDRIARIAWSETGSEFASLLLLYRANCVVFGADEARKRLRLSPPYTVRYAVENRFPRIYVTNHLRRRSLHTTFGPFASRFAAERFCEAVEELFTIRRCYLELHPSPDDPGCIYGEIHKCMAPCQARCTDQQYAQEAEAALAFLQSRGGSLLAVIEAERDRASEEMRFEDAAAAHSRVAKVRAVVALAAEVVQPLSSLRALLLMPRAEKDVAAVDVYMFAGGTLRGPVQLRVDDVRLAREQAEVGSSLFAQPMLLAPVPLDGAIATGAATQSAEERAQEAILHLEDGRTSDDTAELGDTMALLRRWFYRPEKQRVGSIFFRERDAWPVRKILRAAAKLAAAPAPTEATTTEPNATTPVAAAAVAPAADDPAAASGPAL